MPKKRRGARGDGYIAWDKNRQQWRATVPLPEGGSRTKYFARESRSAADAWRQEQLKAIKDKRDLRAERQTVEEALAELLADREYLRRGTLRKYRLWAAHITNAVGTHVVVDVKAHDIARMDRKNREHLTKAVADQILTLAATLYRRLMALQIVTFDPVAAYMAITPARARGGKALRPPVKLDAGLCRRILEKIDPRFHDPCLWLMVYALRWGELCGLRRVNVYDGIIHIVEQRAAETRWEPSEPKNEQSTRQIPAVLPLPPGDSDLVFVDKKGNPLHYDTFRLALKDACEAAKVKYPRPHGLRHTAASGVRRLGCDMDYVAQFLGHRRAGQTEEYAEGTVEQVRPYVEKWAGLILGEKQAQKAE